MYASAPVNSMKKGTNCTLCPTFTPLLANLNLKKGRHGIDTCFAMGIFEGKCLAMECSRSQLLSEIGRCTIVVYDYAIRRELCGTCGDRLRNDII